MRISRALALILCAVGSARADPLLPMKEGMTWEFAVSEQPPAAPGGRLVKMRISGTEERGGKTPFKLETWTSEALTSTDLIGEDEAGVHRYERTAAGDKAVLFNPPQTIVPAPLNIGASWELDDRANDMQMHQKWTVSAEEVVDVPAGTYHAFRFHCEQPWPISIQIDRWFAPGFGFVKDETSTRGPTGRLLSRRTMVLKKLSITAPPPTPAPSVAEATPATTAAASPTETPSATTSPEPSQPSAASSPEKPRIQLEVSSEREGEARTDFPSDTENIFVRWAGSGLPHDVIVRVAWIAEDVGDIVSPNFIIDETSTEVTRSDMAARFTLSRPRDGWAAGKYRVELYLEDDLMQSVKVTIHD